MSTIPQNPQMNPSSSHRAPAKSTGVAFALWFFLGGFGAHRFYFGKTGSAIGMLALFVGSFLTTPILIGFAGLLAFFGWWVFDAIQISKWCAEGSFSSQHAESFPAPQQPVESVVDEPADNANLPMSQAA